MKKSGRQKLKLVHERIRVLVEPELVKIGGGGGLCAAADTGTKHCSLAPHMGCKGLLGASIP
jgi:hypothetical protein